MKSQRFGQFLIPLGFVVCFYPKVSSSLALLLGVILALTVGNPYLAKTRTYVKPMLAWSIIGLGFGVNLMVVLKAGLNGIVFTMISLFLTLLVGNILGRLFKTNEQTSILINVGTAICGGSAIAAVSSAIRAKDESTSIALGVVFILNAIALIIFPQLGHFFGLSQEQFGLWGALAIHDTSSVVGATLQYGPQALEIGTTVKLVRALWIIPLTLIIAKWYNHNHSEETQKTKLQFPWFIGGFLLTSALITWIPLLEPVAHPIEFLAKRTLVVTLYLIGSGLTLATLKKVGPKALAHAVSLWIIVASTSLAAIYYQI